MEPTRTGSPVVTGVDPIHRTRWIPLWEQGPDGGPERQRSRRASAALVDGLVDALDTTPEVVLGFLAGTGRLSLTAAADGTVRAVEETPAELGFPLGPHGSPDAAGITAAGGRVTGAIPPDGVWEHTSQSLMQVTYYAAAIDLADGRGERFVRGAVVDGRALPGGTRPAARDRIAALDAALATLRRLPRSSAEARTRAAESFFGSHAGCHFDADL
ncbi:hypothetical protein CLV92_104137 [Kineococcus xinjiangensis]|uniref:Uncharacterized protein n=1 Tax=Kineococcus xinjiangensis TaxID=512762 RepID=A0A2S6ISU3_9ACTN|nr:hypothetical protein [Kineococcus xinjiangensis]PPK97317.1 hypothetical protein CLV92_104137 [Kineococcus xinjiangensis]